MVELIELKIKDSKNIYQELAVALSPHREKPTGSVEFIVEGTKENPIIGIRYPGRKVKRRVLKVVRENSALWANLYDFIVIPYEDGKEMGERDFTYKKMLKDFYEFKRENDVFWELVEELYFKNTITKEPQRLLGIDSKMYLLVLKWMWIQEDFNYRLTWEEVNSPYKYVLETRTGSRTSKGAGRAKSFAALLLLKHYSDYFTFDEIGKIIPLQ